MLLDCVCCSRLIRTRITVFSVSFNQLLPNVTYRTAAAAHPSEFEVLRYRSQFGVSYRTLLECGMTFPTLYVTRELDGFKGAFVGSLTTRQCYYKGIYIINHDYCLYICIYDVHITHIWTYSAYQIIQQNMVLCNSLNITCILSLYLFLHVFNGIDTTGITFRSQWNQPVYVYICLQIFEITLMLRRAGSRMLCYSD